MTPAAGLTEAVLYDTLVNYLISMARVVESEIGVGSRFHFSIPLFDPERATARSASSSAGGRVIRPNPAASS